MSDDKLSMKEIARLAGTSVATVSRVINRNGRFSKATEERVRSIIEQHDYRPDLLAKGLREDRMKAVGIMISDITSSFFSGIVHEIEAELFRMGYTSILCDTFENEEAEKRFIDMLGNLRISGLICVGGKRTNAPLTNLPVVYVDRKPLEFKGSDADSCFIGSDNYRGGYLAASKLIESGKRNPAIVLYEDQLETISGRLNGFKQALNEHDISFDSSRVFHVDHVAYEDGRLAAQAILDAPARYDSVFFTSDIIAIGGIQYFNDHSIAIPEDIAVIGMDGIPQCSRITPPLTTIRQQYLRFGSLAASAIVQMVNGEPGVDQILDVELVDRETV